MPQRVRYCKVDNIENEVTDLDFRAELEIEPCAAPTRQQGLALLMSLQQTPQLKGHTLQVKAPLGESTIWRPLQEVRIIPANTVLDIKAVKGRQHGLRGPAPDTAALQLSRTASSRAASGPLVYRRTSDGRTKLDVLKDVPLQLS
ncbi:hypothetical protein WJX79_002867 [Trebouxia sp. C0005]|nr:MAG: hypothetical protein FRX49_06531 [Trebouxia sp. A1-2]